MSNATVSYDSVKALTNARFGSRFSDAEDARFEHILNDEVRALYDRSDFWPRWLTLEPRTVKRGYIPDEEDGYNVYGAGSPINGLYVRAGDKNGKPRYAYFDNQGELISLEWDGAQWEIVALAYLDYTGKRVSSGSFDYVIALNDNIYTNSATDATPPESGWESDSGKELPPIVQKLGKIERILWQFDGQKWSGGPSNVLKNYRDKNGIRSTNGSGIVWVAYKAQIDEYGDGTNGTISEIPKEFSRYVALAAAYTMARANRQGNSDPTYAPAYMQVEAAAQDALIGITREGAWNTIMNIHETYYSYDNSIR